MDSSSSFTLDNVKAEKANAMMRYQRFSKIADLFRFLEIGLLLVLVSWFSTRLPVTLTVFINYFKNLSIFLASPCFVFLVGNAIILTLFVKSGHFSCQNSTENSSGTADLYDEFVKNSVTRQKISTGDISPTVREATVGSAQEEICSTMSPNKALEKEKDVTVFEDKEMVTSNKKYERSLSENLKREKPKKELRRSKTDKSCRAEIAKEKKFSREEEEMSNEEFQRKIEAFIAKQVKFLREESMAIVLQN